MVSQIQSANQQVLLVPSTLAGDDAESGQFDALGWDRAMVDLALGTYATSADTLAECVLTEGTDTNPGDNIVAFVGTTDSAVTAGTNGFVIPDGNSTVGQIFKFNIDLRKRERYINLDIVAGESAISAVAIVTLERGDKMPNTTGSNVGVQAIG